MYADVYVCIYARVAYRYACTLRVDAEVPLSFSLCLFISLSMYVVYVRIGKCIGSIMKCRRRFMRLIHAQIHA